MRLIDADALEGKMLNEGLANAIAFGKRTNGQSAHPDAGGSEEQFVTLNAAYEQAVKYFEEAKKG